MFIDLCYPKNNEEKFIQMAKKLSTDGLCFIYDKPVKKISSRLLIRYAIISPSKAKGFVQINNNLSNQSRNKIYIITDCHNLNQTQVLFKKFSAEDKAIGLSLKLFKENMTCINKIALIIRLAQKYKVKLFVGSFAAKPEELKNQRDIIAAFRLLNMNSQTAKASVTLLGELLSSVTFL